MIDTQISKVVDVRTLIEDAIKVQKGIRTRAEVAAENGFDIEGLDAGNAADEERFNELVGKRIQIDFKIDGKVYSGHFENDIAEQLSNPCRRT